MRNIDPMISFGIYLCMEMEKIDISLEFPGNIRYPSNLMPKSDQAVLKALRIHTDAGVERNFQD